MSKGRSRTKEILEHPVTRTQAVQGNWEQQQPKQPEKSIKLQRGTKQPHSEPARTRQQNDGNPEEPTKETIEKDPYQDM